MPIIDVVFLLIVFSFVLFGFWFGFIHTLGSAIGFFIGIFVASHIYDFFGGSIGLKIFIFIFVFVLVGRLVGLVFHLVDKVVSIIKIIPFVSTINRLAGALFGFIEGLLIVTGIVFIVHHFDIEKGITWFSDSEIVPYAIRFSKILLPFVSNTLAKVSTFI